MTIRTVPARDLPDLVRDLPEGPLALTGPAGTYLPITGSVERSSAHPGSVLVEHPLGTLYLEDEEPVTLVAPLTSPLTRQQADDLTADGALTVAVTLDLDELCGEEEATLDAISTAVVGNCLLTGFSYHPVGAAAGGRVVLVVTGDAGHAYAGEDFPGVRG